MVEEGGHGREYDAYGGKVYVMLMVDRVSADRGSLNICSMWRPMQLGSSNESTLNARQPDEPPKRWSRSDLPSRPADMSNRQNELIVTLPETAALEVP